MLLCACACGKTESAPEDGQDAAPDTGDAASDAQPEKEPDKEPDAQPDKEPEKEPEKPTEPEPIDKPAPISATPIFPESTDPDDYASLTRIREENAGTEEFLNALRAFSGDTAKRVLKPDQNGCYSPLSLYLALSLCAAGTAGDTQKEMLSALGATALPSLADNCSRLIRRLYSDSNDYKLKIANALFIDDDARVKEEYVKTAIEEYYSFLKTVDFSDTAKAKEEIKTFISKHTNGKLEYSGTPDPDTRVDIINTLYFISRWSDPFYETATAEDVFHAKGGDVKANFMHKGPHRMAYYAGDGFVRLSLSFVGGARMTFVLPDDGRLSEMLGKGAAAFTDGDEKSAKVDLYLPKFKIKNTCGLEDVLKEIGIKKAFSVNDADFSAMSDEPLYISSVTQGTYISVDEKGAEAAAYTEISMLAGAAFDPDEPVVIRFDRPFMYQIEAFDGTPLFCGVVADPSK